MAWNQSNRAAKTTWTTLMLLEQFQATFVEAGNLKMNVLLYWKETQSDSARRHDAESLAIQIDKVFREVRGAEFEHGVTRLQAIEQMLNILTREEKTVSELAEVADKSYRFWREKDQT